jgi:hypothetical protein
VSAQLKNVCTIQACTAYTHAYAVRNWIWRRFDVAKLEAFNSTVTDDCDCFHAVNGKS